MKVSDHNLSEIGARMKAARNMLKLSQEALASAVGGSKRGIQDNEARNRVPGGEVIAGFIGLGINPVWLLTGEGQMLLSEMDSLRVKQPVERYVATQDAGMAAMNMASPGEILGSGLEIDGNMLETCHDACRGVYGAAFDEISAVVQLGYATDLYNLLVKMSAQNGGLDKMKCLEATGMVELLNVFIRLGWAKKFPPPPSHRRDCFF